jgi:hypothetical protein
VSGRDQQKNDENGSNASKQLLNAGCGCLKVPCAMKQLADALVVAGVDGCCDFPKVPQFLNNEIAIV